MLTKSTEYLSYKKNLDTEENWEITENYFDISALAKTESIFALGNGYLGLRSANEEKYVGETRGLFINGTFNKADGFKEVSELPNGADVLELDFFLNGHQFNLQEGKILHYEKILNLRKALLTRKITWEAPDGELYELIFNRFASLDNKHIIAQKISITPLTSSSTLKIKSGINGQLTNTGTQHFKEGELRLFDNQILKLDQETTESKVKFSYFSKHEFHINNKTIFPRQTVFMERRRIYMDFSDIQLGKNETLEISKISSVYTSRDKDCLVDWNNSALSNMKTVDSYDDLFQAHTHAWEENVWGIYNIKIQGDDFAQLANRFAIYHLINMTPSNDNRMGIGAKGLTGEGYKGHSFWDTEIFILPMYTAMNPSIARSLLEYRGLTISGARKKALENNYKGAMYPWESAWMDDGEVTPVYGAADIVTGEYTKIWSGFIEQHISADIAYAIWQYFQFTDDIEYMEKFGYEIVIATAIFWVSRLEWNENKNRYDINQVIGPDEYKEHVDNNAYTNYLAHFNMTLALTYYNELSKSNPELLERIDKEWALHTHIEAIEDSINKIYLPQPNQENVIPQDDTYLSKKIIDLTKYKNEDNVGTLFLDYNLDQVNDMQITKQSDVVILLFLLENIFNNDVKQKNYEYYEPKTLHDSSLSRTTHSIIASDLNLTDEAYEMYLNALKTDLGPAKHSSDAGVHSASLGGILQATINGFGGVRMVNGKLRISPSLPKHWTELEFPLNWKGAHLIVSITEETLMIINTSPKDICINISGLDTPINRNSTVKIEL